MANPIKRELEDWSTALRTNHHTGGSGLEKIIREISIANAFLAELLSMLLDYMGKVATSNTRSSRFDPDNLSVGIFRDTEYFIWANAQSQSLGFRNERFLRCS